MLLMEDEEKEIFALTSKLKFLHKSYVLNVSPNVGK